MTRVGRRLAAGLLVALAGVAAVAGAGGAQTSAPRITSAAWVTNGQDEPVERSYTSPGVVVDPDDSRLVYAATVDIRSTACALLRSADGGRTWVKAKGTPAPQAFPKCTHDNGLIPMSFLAMGREKTLYFLHIGWDVQDGGRSENRSVFVGRSDDGGETWESTPVNVNRGKTGNDTEKNVPQDLVVDTRGDQDVVYVSYTASYPNPNTPPTRPGQPFVAVSADGARTFGQPVNISDSFYADTNNLPTDLTPAQRDRANFGGGNANLAVDGKGNVYATWNRSSANITPLAPLAATYVAKSTDKGATWASTVLQAPMDNQTGPGGVQFDWSPAGGPTGSLHVVWEGKPTAVQGDRDVMYKRSADEGRTWSDAQVLNDEDPTQYFPQYQPNLSIGPDGRIEVVWFDFRNSAGLIATDVFGTTSRDGGATWSKNVRITDQLTNRRIGVWKPGFGGDVRQPPGVAAGDGLTVVVWDDTRNGNLQVEAVDLYAATLQYEALARTSGLPKGVAYGLGATIGVAAVGLLMVLGATLMPGRRGPPQPASPAGSGQDEVVRAG